jgi:hypothetical protein
MLLLPILELILKIVVLVLEGQTPEQRSTMTGWFIANVEKMMADLSPEARAKAWSWLIAVVEQWQPQLKIDPS